MSLRDSKQPERRESNRLGVASPCKIVRKGKGITGTGVSNLNPHLSGRLTLGMLNKMHEMRKDDQFAIPNDNEFEKIK